jgi:CelD/BcsL family acetyltransferase involved in cellulose biosynthesis
VGGQLSDYFGIVAEEGFSLEPRRLLSLAGLNTLRFTNLEESQSSFGLSGEGREIGHRIDFPQGGAEYWTARRRLDKRFVTDTERRERKAVEEYGPIRFTFCETSWEMPLAQLMSAKRAQYARTGVRDALSDARNRDFLARLAGSKDPLCSGTMSTLYAGDTWIASHFGLVCNKTLHYWFPAYNPELRSLSPGRLLLKSIIDASDETGIARIDRGAGDTVAKRDFSTSSHSFHRGLWYRSNAISLGYRLGLSLRWRLARHKMGTAQPE